MSTLIIQRPESLKKTFEDLAAREGYSMGQFLASAAKPPRAAVPDAPPQPGDEL
jgi:hypothetical protein